MSFVETIKNSSSGITLNWKVGQDGMYEESHERRGPQEEAIDAFVLTFRYFIQDNEVTSFRKMTEIYADSLVNLNFKNEFNEIRKEINNFLDSPPNFQIQIDSKVLSRREIMDVFIYGGLSHANPFKKKQYDQWMSIPPFKPISENEFVYILSNVFNGIGWIKNLNLKVLEDVEK